MSTAPLRVALTALGCKVNYAEMAELAGTLAAAGCDVVPDSEPADVRVLNSCTVTLQADATTRQRLARLRRADPECHLVLTGCSVDANPQSYQRHDSAGNLLLPRGIDAVFSNLDKQKIAQHITGLAPRLDVSTSPPLRARAFLKVQDGCNHRCTYCIVWRARGESRSVAAETVLRKARDAVDAGHGELVLCGVDLGSYGRGEGTTLAALVETLLGAVGDRARIRLSSINANDIGRELIALNAHPRLCAHWHIPLQSGSDAVLKAMHRGYRRAQYLRVVRELRAQDPDTEITSDIMVAFPGETESAHRETIALVEEVGMAGAHVFRWSPRPGTPATELDGRIDARVAARRSAEVRAAAARTAAAARQRAVGREWEVVWDRVAAGRAHGLTATYQEVEVDADARTLPGRLDRIRVDAVDGERLHATLIRP